MNRHLKLAVAASILFGLAATGVASAADMAVKARPVVAPVVYPWTGCFIGGNVGGAWSKMDTTLVGQDGIGPVFANYGREKDSGFIGGGQVGCDFQTSNLVFGVGGSFDFGNVKRKPYHSGRPGFGNQQSQGDLHGDRQDRLPVDAGAARLCQGRHGVGHQPQLGVPARRRSV